MTDTRAKIAAYTGEICNINPNTRATLLDMAAEADRTIATLTAERDELAKQLKEAKASADEGWKVAGARAGELGSMATLLNSETADLRKAERHLAVVATAIADTQNFPDGKSPVDRIKAADEMLGKLLEPKKIEEFILGNLNKKD